MSARKIKVTYILSDIQKSLAFEWVVTHLNSDKFQLSFVLFHDTEDTEMQRFLEKNQVPFHFIYLHSKKNYPFALCKLMIYFLRNRPDIIHTNLRDADFIGQIAGFILRIKKRVTTRHSSSFNHLYFPHAVKWDRMINFLSTDIISISKATKTVLVDMEHVPEFKIHDIPHGFDLKFYHEKNIEKIELLSSKYNPRNNKPVIGVVSRYISWKGIEYTIRAFKKYLEKYPNAILILANASGGYKEQIQKELEQIPKYNYIEISFENDINSLYRLFDIFVHVPIDHTVEAFGQIYIESMASGIPSIFTLSGIANEIAVDRENCLVVKYKNSEEIWQAMTELTENIELKNKIIKGAVNTSNDFDIESNIRKLEKIYECI